VAVRTLESASLRLTSLAVKAARIRRRRVAVGAVCGLAIAAFAFGAVLSDRGSRPAPSAVSRLSLPQLVGTRLIAGFQGTEVPEPL
jgi:hypothetical protein